MRSGKSTAIKTYSETNSETKTRTATETEKETHFKTTISPSDQTSQLRNHTNKSNIVLIKPNITDLNNDISLITQETEYGQGSW